MDHREIYCVDGTGSGSCQMVVVLVVLNLLVLLPESQLISKMDHREIYCVDGTGSGSCQIVVVLAVLNVKFLLAESLISRRELGRHKLQVSQTENTCKLSLGVGKHDTGLRKTASPYSCFISAGMLYRY